MDFYYIFVQTHDGSLLNIIGVINLENSHYYNMDDLDYLCDLPTQLVSRIIHHFK